MPETTADQHGRMTCEACGGSGQVAYFGGVSRFVMTWEECSECLGTGYIDIPAGKNENRDNQKPPD